jgi:arylesterase/paraoxonase
MWLKIVGISALVVVLALGGFILRTLYLSGYFRSIEPHFAGSCRLVKGPVGSEDLTIDHDVGVAFISSTDRRASRAATPRPGAIYLYDLNRQDAVPVNLTPDATTAFQPHGISLWIGPDGRRALYVINHPAPGTADYTHSVEVYDVIDGALRHRATILDTRLVMPNDLVAVGESLFYLTNTHANPPGRMQTVETYLRLRGAGVEYYGRYGLQPAVENLVFPNGINVSRDLRTVYVATTTSRELLVYDRDPHTGALDLRRRIPVGVGLDNIEVDEDGNLWIGAHPKLMAVGAHGEDPTRLSPSQVYRIRFEGEEAEVDEIYLNRGDEISAVSVAARHGDRLLLGQIFGDGILDCRLSAAD